MEKLGYHFFIFGSTSIIEKKYIIVGSVIDDGLDGVCKHGYLVDEGYCDEG